MNFLYKLINIGISSENFFSIPKRVHLQLLATIENIMNIQINLRSSTTLSRLALKNPSCEEVIQDENPHNFPLFTRRIKKRNEGGKIFQIKIFSRQMSILFFDSTSFSLNTLRRDNLTTFEYKGTSTHRSQSCWRGLETRVIQRVVS